MTIPAYLQLLNDGADTAWITREDLDSAIGSATVDQFFTDNGRIVNTVAQTRTLRKAEQKALSILLRAYTVQEIDTLMKTDEFQRGLVVDIALEYASRRKKEFTSEDGKGRFYQQFDEACKAFDKLSHGRLKTPAQVSNVQEGGMVGPRVRQVPNDTRTQFIFSDPTTGRSRGY